MEAIMSLEENKNIVRRFITEVLAKGDLMAADQLLAPDYMNSSLPGQGAEQFKQFISMSSKAFTGTKYSIKSMIAEGDQVVVRFSMSGTYTGSIMGSKPTGKAFSVRGLTYYRLANGKIVEDEPYTSPDMMQLLGLPMPEQVT
jgi:predicted ester cyclase